MKGRFSFVYSMLTHITKHTTSCNEMLNICSKESCTGKCVLIFLFGSLFSNKKWNLFFTIMFVYLYIIYTYTYIYIHTCSRVYISRRIIGYVYQKRIYGIEPSL